MSGADAWLLSSSEEDIPIGKLMSSSSSAAAPKKNDIPVKDAKEEEQEQEQEEDAPVRKREKQPAQPAPFNRKAVGTKMAPLIKSMNGWCQGCITQQYEHTVTISDAQQDAIAEDYATFDRILVRMHNAIAEFVRQKIPMVTLHAFMTVPPRADTAKKTTTCGMCKEQRECNKTKVFTFAAPPKEDGAVDVAYCTEPCAMLVQLLHSVYWFREYATEMLREALVAQLAKNVVPASDSWDDHWIALVGPKCGARNAKTGESLNILEWPRKSPVSNKETEKQVLANTIGSIGNVFMAYYILLVEKLKLTALEQLLE